MYCPQCGQQQSFEEMRFCSRCGFALGGVAELLANNGVLPTSTYIATVQSNKLALRSKGLRRGTLLLLIGAILTPLLAVLIRYLAHDDNTKVLVPLSAIIFFLGGFLRILYAILFENVKATADNHEAAFLPSHGAMLNVGQTHTRDAATLPSFTGEPVPTRKTSLRSATLPLVSPSSVTENTTRLLNDE